MWQEFRQVAWRINQDEGSKRCTHQRTGCALCRRDRRKLFTFERIEQCALARVRLPDDNDSVLQVLLHILMRLPPVDIFHEAAHRRKAGGQALQRRDS